MNNFRYYLAALGAVAAVHAVQAFSLIGPFDPGQVADIGYDVGLRTFTQQGDLGGPRNIGDEYRWSSPIITYGFDASFLDYFGTNGVIAVTKAIQIFNALPNASKMSAGLHEYPLRTSGVNFAAQRLHLYDIKSFTLSILCEQLGLAAPERYVWTLKTRYPLPGNQNIFLTINRNYDPVSQIYSPFVNGTRYSFAIGTYTLPDGTVYYDTRKVAIDAAEPNITVASLHGIQAGAAAVDDRVERTMGFRRSATEGQPSASGGAFGLYFSGLTRDDVGGIRYLIDPRNKNYESAPTGSTAQNSSGATVISSSSAGASSGGSGGSSAGTVWTVIDGVNNAGTATGGGTTGGTTGTTNVVTLPFTNEALRSGVDKITFIRVDLDPITRRNSRPMVVQYNETITTNGVSVTQRVQRALIQPDILFSAADIGDSQFSPFVYNRTLTFSDPTRSDPGVVNNPNNTLAYPGNINGNVDVTFSAIGPYYTGGDVGSHQGNNGFGFLWGSFDGTTNRPVVFPEGRVDLLELERAALNDN